MLRKSKKMSVFGFAVGVATVILGSTAYACIAYRGDLTITGSSVTSNLMTGKNDGGMNYCTGRNPTTAAAGRAGSSVSISVAPGTACNSTGTNKLQDVKHDVRMRNGKYWTYNGSSWSMVSSTGCWITNPPAGQLLGQFTPSSGSYTGSFTIPSTYLVNLTNEASQFCVGETTDDGNRGGILAPFRVVL